MEDNAGSAKRHDIMKLSEGAFNKNLRCLHEFIKPTLIGLQHV